MHGRGSGDGGVLAAADLGQDERHLAEPAGPELSRRWGQLALDSLAQDRFLAFGLLLVGEHEPALPGLQHLEGVGLHRGRLEKPAGELG